MNYKLLAVILLVIAYLWKAFILFLKYRSVKNKLPDNVRDVYDAEKYKTWKAYFHENARLTVVSTCVMLAVQLVIYISNAYAAFASLFPDNDFIQAFAVIGLSLVIAQLFDLPFSWFDTFRIEEKYGFNKSTKKTFALDQIKSFVIGLLLNCLLVSAYIWLSALGNIAFISFAVFLVLFVLLISFLSPWLTKIFNHFTPLEDGELKEKLTGLLEKNGYHVRAIQVMDASKRSTRSNAYFTGFGKSKTIVLYDNMLGQMTTDEICAVFAHEMGHGLHRDTLRMQLMNSIQLLIIALFIYLNASIPAICQSFGFIGVNYGLCLLLMSDIELELIHPLLGLAMNAYSRKAEFRADKQAADEGYGKALISGLKTLHRENLADLSPDPLLVRLTYSHPTLSQRISAIKKD